MCGSMGAIGGGAMPPIPGSAPGAPTGIPGQPDTLRQFTSARGMQVGAVKEPTGTYRLVPPTGADEVVSIDGKDVLFDITGEDVTARVTALGPQRLAELKAAASTPKAAAATGTPPSLPVQLAATGAATLAGGPAGDLPAILQNLVQTLQALVAALGSTIGGGAPTKAPPVPPADAGPGGGPITGPAGGAPGMLPANLANQPGVTRHVVKADSGAQVAVLTDPQTWSIRIERGTGKPETLHVENKVLFIDAAGNVTGGEGAAAPAPALGQRLNPNTPGDVRVAPGAGTPGRSFVDKTTLAGSYVTMSSDGLDERSVRLEIGTGKNESVVHNGLVLSFDAGGKLLGSRRA